MNKELKKFENKSILVLGFGREGESGLRFLQKHSLGKKIGVADRLEFKSLPKKQRTLLEKNKKITLYLGKDYLKALKQYQIIIKSPGIADKIIAPYITRKQIITSQTEIFLTKHRSNTIGITGTKGKGTTASLIYKILKDNKIKTELIGNIGKPALDYFDRPTWPTADKVRGLGAFFVYELSSHQLKNLKISPHIAVFLNIYPEHLDYYKNFQEYFSAKKNIAKWQGKNDYFIFNADFRELKKIAGQSKAKKKTFGKARTNNCFFDQKNIFLRSPELRKFRRKHIPLPGEHFAYDVMAALLVSDIFNIPNSSVEKSIKQFKGLPHRLEFVGEFKNIKFYNDSLATVPEAAIYALDALKNVDTIILGGFDRGVDFKKLALKIKEKNIKNFIFFPDSGKRIWREIKKQKLNNSHQYFFTNNMKEAIKIAIKHTKVGKTCLLSPASPSFGIFKDYADRGNQFKKYIHNAKNTKSMRKIRKKIICD
jgi:UDP-N-acetylmuramoyl-L-alanine---L-glutamate ligase